MRKNTFTYLLSLCAGEDRMKYYRGIPLILLTACLMSCGDNRDSEKMFAGLWYSCAVKDDGDYVYTDNHIKLFLYEDNMLSIEGQKGYWAFSDWNLMIVRVEIPTSQHQSDMHEMHIHFDDELNVYVGTMRINNEWRFFQKIQLGSPHETLENPFDTLEKTIKDLKRIPQSKNER